MDAVNLGNLNDIIFRTLIESSSDSIYVKDRELRTVFCNALFASAVGKKPSEMYGKTDIENGWNPEFVKGNPLRGIRGFEQDDLEVLAGATVHATDEPVNIGSEVRIFDTVKSPLRDEQGRVIGILGIGRDVTERKRLQQSLSSEHALLLSLINTLPDHVFLKDRDGRYLLVNQAQALMVGAADPQELVGKTDYDFVTKELADRYAAADRKVMETGKELINVEEPLVMISGAIRWVLTTKVPIHDLSGAVSGLVGISRDITERKKEEQIHREQAALLDIATDAIFVFDMGRRIQYWNAGAERIFGWRREEARGRDIEDVLFRESPPGEADKAREIVLHSGEWAGDLHQRSRDGKPMITEARWTLMKDAEGRPSGILAVHTDVTEPRSVQSQLLRVQRLDSLGALAGGIAHDLNNVLSPILMGAETLALEHSDESSREILEIIRTAAERGGSLVHQVLGFARGLEADYTEVQPKHVLREVGQIVRETFPKSIQYEGRVPSDLWPVRGDATQLHQVLMNLCVNARDAMPEGGKLSVSAENIRLDEAYVRMNVEARPIRYVMVHVEDTGTGMAPGIVDKIFTPFFTTKAPGKGTGLGLSTTRTIVKSHGGFIKVDSEPGRGSSFKVYIPALEGPAAKPAGPGPAGMPRGSGELILIVDDEKPVRDVTRQILVSHGYRVLTAENGIAAVAVYAERKSEISVVITDMMMPYMDGAATIRAIRRIAPGALIISTSGVVANGRAKESKGAGASAFLAKPYTAEALLKTLRAVLSPPAPEG